MHRGRSSVLALLAVAAGLALPSAAGAAQSNTEYLQSGQYAKDVIAAAVPASAWIQERSDQLVALTTACRAYGLPVGPNGKATTPTIVEPTAAQRAAVTSTAKAVEPSVARPTDGDCRGVIAPAVVFDIDETLLSNYIGVPGSDPEAGSIGQFPGALSGTGTRMPGVGDTYALAKKLGMAIFLVTARPEPLPGLRDTTVRNLAAAGYSGYLGLSLKPDPAASSAVYKAGERAKIEARGYTIVANVGDQESDLAGGYAERRFKIPNPFYTG